MIKTKNAKNVSIKEEIEAAKLEQERPSRPMSSHNFTRWVQAHTIRNEISILEERLKGLQKHLYKELDNSGVDVLTRRGIVIFSRDWVDGNHDFDLEGLAKDHPDIFAQYYRGRKPKYPRVNWKKFIQF